MHNSLPGGFVSVYSYIPPDDGELDDVSFVNISFADGGGLISNPENMFKFFQALLTGQLLKPPSLREMFRFEDIKEQRDDLISRRFGLVIKIIQAESLDNVKFRYIGFGGNTLAGFGTRMWLYPDKGVILEYLENK